MKTNSLRFQANTTIYVFIFIIYLFIYNFAEGFAQYGAL